MNNVYHIAVNTFREAVRDKVLYVIIFFALLMVLVSRAIGWISVGQQEQVVKHFSLAVMSFFGALIAVFIGTALIYKEIDKRTIYTILSKPVSRYEFLLGKFAGLVSVLFIVLSLMGVIVCLFIKMVLAGTINYIFIEAMLLTFFELSIVTALAVMFSTVASPILSAIFTFSCYLVGQVTPSLLDIVNFKPLDQKGMELETVDVFSKFLTVSHEVVAPLSKVVYYILPNLTHFSLRNRVVYGPDLAQGEFVSAVVYACFYCSAVLFAAVLLFNRKKF
ncbi:MAG: ABC transporter permease [Planctomycetota bacterium]|jgi:ABC-type transport system involved in multi-copper enzyme maturation permease subunit